MDYVIRNALHAIIPVFLVVDSPQTTVLLLNSWIAGKYI
jgi:hypothetical protein